MPDLRVRAHGRAAAVRLPRVGLVLVEVDERLAVRPGLDRRQGVGEPLPLASWNSRVLLRTVLDGHPRLAMGDGEVLGGLEDRLEGVPGVAGPARIPAVAVAADGVDVGVAGVVGVEFWPELGLKLQDIMVHTNATLVTPRALKTVTM